MHLTLSTRNVFCFVEEIWKQSSQNPGFWIEKLEKPGRLELPHPECFSRENADSEQGFFLNFKVAFEGREYPLAELCLRMMLELQIPTYVDQCLDVMLRSLDCELAWRDCLISSLMQHVLSWPGMKGRHLNRLLVVSTRHHRRDLIGQLSSRALDWEPAVYEAVIQGYQTLTFELMGKTTVNRERILTTASRSGNQKLIESLRLFFE